MNSNSTPNLFRPLREYRHKTKIIKSAVALAGAEEHPFVAVNGQAGKLDYVHVNLEHNTGLLLHVEADKQDLVRHTAEDIEGTGAGTLALEIPNAVSDVLSTTKSTSLNYGITFKAHLVGVTFKNSMKVTILNIGSTEYDLQAGYVLFGIERRYKDA